MYQVNSLNNQNNSRSIKDIDSVLESIISRIREIADPEKIIVFGSVGRGDNNPDSDIDLLVIKSGSYDPISLAGDIYVHLHGIRQSVDIILSSPEEIERNHHFQGSVLYPAMREGRVIYEAETSA
jgi:uncharacterized protein